MWVKTGRTKDFNFARTNKMLSLSAWSIPSFRHVGVLPGLQLVIAASKIASSLAKSLAQASVSFLPDSIARMMKFGAGEAMTYSSPSQSFLLFFFVVRVTAAPVITQLPFCSIGNLQDCVIRTVGVTIFEHDGRVDLNRLKLWFEVLGRVPARAPALVDIVVNEHVGVLRWAPIPCVRVAVKVATIDDAVITTVTRVRAQLPAAAVDVLFLKESLKSSPPPKNVKIVGSRARSEGRGDEWKCVHVAKWRICHLLLQNKIQQTVLF